MRIVAVIAVALTAVVLGVGGQHASAAEIAMNTNGNDFVNKVLLASTEPAGDASDTSNTAQKDTEQEATQPAPAPAPEQVIVTVQKGDNLSKIAAAYDTTWRRIFDANPSIANPDVINPGETLRIPAADEQLTERALPASAPVTNVTTKTTRTTTTARTASHTSYPVSPNAAKAYIYARESGNNPNATNPNGCYGLGQDCNGVVRTMCGADYACQDAYFTRYAMARYGSWENALAFWQSHHWW